MLHDTHADAALIAFGEQLAAAIAIERATIAAIPEDIDVQQEVAALEAATAPTSALLDQIEPLHASTLGGFFVKDLAHRYVYGELQGWLN